MTIPTVRLFSSLQVLSNPNVFPVDISETKRSMIIGHNKAVYSPDIIEEEYIKVVIIAVPSHIMSISYQVRNNYKCVTTLIDASQLAMSDIGILMSAL